MPKVKDEDRENCVWYEVKYRKEQCKILKEMQCKKKGKCSFFETEVQHRLRQERFKEKHGELG